MKKFITIAICITVLFTFAACGGMSESDSIAGVEYYHYDPDKFYADCSELEAIASTDDPKGVISMYDKLYSECEEINSLYSVAYVKYSCNMANEYFSDEQIYTYGILNKCTDKLSGACRKITEGPNAAAFREHIGNEAFDYFTEYENMTPEEEKLINREQKLVDKYYSELDKSENESFDYKGESWNMEKLMGDAGEALAVSDYDTYAKIYKGIMKKTNQKTGPIYVKLVELRDRIADLYGYDSYAEYADTEIYDRDYDSNDIDRLQDETKKIAHKYYDSLYSAAMLGDSPYMPEISEQEMLSALNKYSGDISAMAKNSCVHMLENDLYNIGDSDARQEGAYTTFIEKTDSPFLFMTLDGQSDYATLTHEFGHFVEYDNDKQSNILIDSSNIDLAEVASNGFQGLMTSYYQDIFGSESEPAVRYVVGDLMENLIQGCIMDEFQREIYNDPDMTLDEINSTYADVCEEYDPENEDTDGYGWIYVSHNFESPMYYISYSVSALAALQIWDQSLEDPGMAAKAWESFIDEGTYNKTYLDVVDKCGLIKFTEKDAVKNICQPALDATNVRALN